MGAALVVAGVIGAFFIVGLIVGAIIAIALPILRGTRGRNKRRESAGRAGQPEGDGQMPDARVGRDETAPDDRPRWPGDADNGYGR
jgi:hypothetical protein